jgi:hypothetical protein
MFLSVVILVVSPQRLTRWPLLHRHRHAATYTTPRDVNWMDGMRRWKKALRQKLPFSRSFRFWTPPTTGRAKTYAHVRLREQLAAAYGVVRSQIPGHNPAHAKLPPWPVNGSPAMTPAMTSPGVHRSP